MNKTLKLSWLLLVTIAFPSFLFSQEGEAGIKWGGFVKVDMFNDSRAVVAARDDMFMLYPAGRVQVTQGPGGTATNSCGLITNPDACQVYIYGNNEDLNAVKQTSITTIQSRLTGNITGPDAFGAKIKGLIEFDFFGTSNSYAHLARLRHATVDFDWGTNKLKAGLWWHPLFVAGYHPDTIQFSPLSPIHPFSRAPQIRYTHSIGLGGEQSFNIHVIALYRAYHADFGPSNNGPSAADGTPAYNSRFKRWADKPDIDIQLEYKGEPFSGGITYEMNELRPYDRVVSYDGTTTATQLGNNKNTVKGAVYQLFGKFTIDKGSNTFLKFNYVKGQNTANNIMLGGYAQIKNLILDNATLLGIPAADVALIKAFTKKEYTPINITSYWLQFTTGKETEFSLIMGRSTNDGASKDIDTSSTGYFGRGSNIKEVTSVIPQLKFKSGKTMIGIMLGHFEAKYMEDDKSYKAVTQAINTQAGIAGTDYSSINLAGFVIPNPAVRDSKGVINKTYTVVDRRLQVSVQQNF